METTKQILKSLTLLYAEDDEVLRETTLQTLKVLFKDVYTAQDGVEAFNIYSKKNNKCFIFRLYDAKYQWI